MMFNRFFSLALSGAFVLAFAVSSGPAWCLEATQEQNLALLKAIDADLAKKPGDVELQVRHMQALGVARRFDDELKEADLLIAKFPRLRAAHKGRMFAQVGLGNWSGAMTSIEQLKKLGALSASELATRGAILTRLGRYNDALLNLNQSISLDSSDAGSFFSRAECLFKLNGPSVDAVRNLEQTLKLDPSFPNAKKLLDYMRSKLASSAVSPSR